MKLQPFKRVGEPTSFKGIKGAYLFMAMYFTGGAVFILLLFFIAPLSPFIQMIIACITVGLWAIKINDLKKKSKSGDINLLEKNRCRKNINIKGSRIKNDKKKSR